MKKGVFYTLLASKMLYKLKKDVVHLIGIDQNNILHDVSNNTEAKKSLLASSGL